MSDIKLFKLTDSSVQPISASTLALERSLQELMERNLEQLLGIRFIASEYATGKKHAGRIDTLGIDENGSPVIIEYKRSLNDSVINQGLFYLDWLLDHRGEFELLVLRKYGEQASAGIDWTGPRLVCIAGSFTKYDEHAVQQIDRNIELLRYAKYGEDLLMLDLVNRAYTEPPRAKAAAVTPDEPANKAPTESILDTVDQLEGSLADLHKALDEFLLSLGTGDEVTPKPTKLYLAYRRIKNFACVRPQSDKIIVWTKVDPDEVQLESGFTRDVREVGHYGTGDLEIVLRTLRDLERAQSLLRRSFEDN